MARATRPVQFLFSLCIAVLLADSGPAAADPEQASAKRSLAGQVCPSGSFVFGFDAEGDILCSAACGNGVLNPGESCDDGNTSDGDGCSASCQSESAAVTPGAAVAGTAAVAAVPVATEAAAAPTMVTAAAPADAAAETEAAGLVISDIEPSSVVYGTRELDVTILGDGIKAGSIIEFAGQAYTPTVNPEGTRAEVTLTTRRLTLGAYALTVSNPSGQKVTLKKALVVY